MRDRFEQARIGGLAQQGRPRQALGFVELTALFRQQKGQVVGRPHIAFIGGQSPAQQFFRGLRTPPPALPQSEGDP